MPTDKELLQARIDNLANLIQKARLSSRKEPPECAQAMGTSLERYISYETGELSPTLPELEELAFYLDMPFEYFRDQATLLEAGKIPKLPNPELLIKLRHKIIAARLKQTRLNANYSLEYLAGKSGFSTEQLISYETGNIPIPLPHLELLAESLAISIVEFQDNKGPIGTWAEHKRELQSYLALPAELRTFVSRPVNHPYLELAKRMSEMSVEKLRTIAEGLLEITL